LAKLDVDTVDWVGTSMGGILGMIFAGLPGTPVRRLVMNDVGSFIPKASIERIGLYLGQDPPYERLEDLEADLRRVSPFGPLTDAQWRHLAIHAARRDDDG